MLPYVVELVFVNASTSPVRKPLLIETFAEASVRLSTSLTVAADNSVTGVPDAGLLSTAVWGVPAATVLSPGAASCAVMVSVVVCVVLGSVPSLTTHVIVRLVSLPKLVGLVLVEEY